MRIIIVGASEFGVATVTELIDKGHQAVLIDTNRDKLDQLADGLDCAMICADGTLPSVLRDAYGDGAEALVALTNKDDVDILASVVGRSVGFPRVIPQIVRSELISVLEELELDDVIAPHENLARSIVNGLIQHSEVETEMTLHRDLRLVTHKVPASMKGKTLGDLDLPDDTRPVVRISDDHEYFADDETTLEEGDRIMLIVRLDAKTDAAAIFEATDD